MDIKLIKKTNDSLWIGNLSDLNQKNLLYKGTIISAMMLLFLSGLIISDIINRDYHGIAVISFLITFILFTVVGITLWYRLIDDKWKEKGYEIWKTHIRNAVKIQQFLLVGYLSITIIFLCMTDKHGYNFFEELIMYRMIWIVLMLLLVFPSYIEIVILLHYTKRINNLQSDLNQLDVICSNVEMGNTTIENPYPPESRFYHYGKAFAEINREIKQAVNKQINSEKMKVDLITNISHDLKTPLTSVMSYIELMKKEELTEELKDYTDIMSAKTILLKEMIENLFELSKASSGNAELKFEEINMNRLVEQILADLEHSHSLIKDSIRLKLTEENSSFFADSPAMYRVCQNLFENALKYSLEGTRIYIMTSIQNHRICLKILNTANYEMDFEEQEILRRFTRGDKARTTEGNGLGLAIAKTYTEACRGEFNLKIAGDQFCTEISFPILAAPSES